MLKTLAISLALSDPPTAPGIPVVARGTLSSGYYTDQTTGIRYYYDAAGDRWYYVSGSLLYPLALTWKPSPSPKIELIAGNVLRFSLSFKYQGPAITKNFYAVLGANTKSGSFNEWSGFATTKDITIPQSSSPTLITGNSLDLVLPPGHEGEDAAAYCKMDGVTLTEGVNATPLYYDVAHIVGSEFSEFGITKFEKVS